jgi:hypothetical protein
MDNGCLIVWSMRSHKLRIDQQRCDATLQTLVRDSDQSSYDPDCGFRHPRHRTHCISNNERFLIPGYHIPYTWLPTSYHQDVTLLGSRPSTLMLLANAQVNQRALSDDAARHRVNTAMPL